ncbi:penicillin acylase family protein [Brachybacterium sp. GPGPB12]|uniref:penicillin acylase family protein n=1 Tax=Brachybacterium sp. GPGPB12 TaxID=3023517 RepID=UPI00313440E8
MAADSSGSIGAAFCGATPHRPGGSFEDSRRRSPGHDRSLIWEDLNPPLSLPRVIDPDCGWVQNVNETPWWFCDPPLDPADHPDGIAPAPDRIRDIRSPLSRARMAATERLGPEDLLELKWDTRAHLADIVLDQLLAAAGTDEALAEAVRVLRDWDRHAEAGSRGRLLFHLWAHDHFPVGEVVMDDSRLTPAPEPGGLPTGSRDPEEAVRSLRRAVAALTGWGLPLDAAFGEVARIGEAPEDVPASGGPTYFGLFKCLEIVPGEGTWPAIGGDSWVCLVRYGAEAQAASGLLVAGSGERARSRRHTRPDPPLGPAAVRRRGAARARALAPCPVPLSAGTLSRPTDPRRQRSKAPRPRRGRTPGRSTG